MSLTKNDIIEQLQTELGLPRNRIEKIVDCLLDRMKSTLESGEDLLISGFGKFCIETKNGVIMLQGDHREAVRAELENLGFKAKIAGG